MIVSRYTEHTGCLYLNSEGLEFRLAFRKLFPIYYSSFINISLHRLLLLWFGDKTVCLTLNLITSHFLYLLSAGSLFSAFNCEGRNVNHDFCTFDSSSSHVTLLVRCVLVFGGTVFRLLIAPGLCCSGW